MHQKKIAIELIVVANSQHAKFFSREGQKLELLEEKFMDPHHNPEKHSSSYRTKGTRSHSFDPHTSAKDIDNDKAAKMIVDHLHGLVSVSQGQQARYKEIIITAEPKLLGHIRHSLESDKIVHNLVTKEVAKDFINEDINHLQKLLDDNL